MSSITLRRNGATRTIPTGYSWTTMFFGPFPSMLRGHWPGVWAIVGLDFASLLISGGILSFADLAVIVIFARWWAGHFRNGFLLNTLLADGWSVEDTPADFSEIVGAPDAVNDEDY